MSVNIQIGRVHVAYAAMTGAGVAGLVLAGRKSSEAVGERYLNQLLVDPIERLADKDNMVLERKRRSRGDSAAMAAAIGGVALGGVGGILMLGGTGPAQASHGAKQLLRALGGAGMLGAGVGIAGGGLIAYQYFADAQMRPA